MNEMKLNEANKRLNEIEFFNLMQQYRIAPIIDQGRVIDAFEAVKDWIVKNYSKLK